VIRLYCSNSSRNADTSAVAAESGGRISLTVRQRIGAHEYSRIQLTGMRCLVGSSSGTAPHPKKGSEIGRQLTRFALNQLVQQDK